MIFADRNKTEITRRVTLAAVNYLADRGFKPIETEVPAAGFGIVDVAGACEMTRSEAVKLKLFERRPEIKLEVFEIKALGESERQALYDDYEKRVDDWNARFHLFPSPVTAIIEIKTSRSDFQRDVKKFKKPSPADLRYLAAPTGLLRMHERPAGWCMMEVDTADRVHIKAPAQLHPMTNDARLSLIYQIAMRHYNRHSYAMMRDLQKERRITINQSENRTRWNTVMRCLLMIAKGDGEFYGKSVADVLRYNRVTGVSREMIREMEKLWGKFKA